MFRDEPSSPPGTVRKIELPEDVVAYLKNCGKPVYNGPLQEGPGFRPRLVAEEGEEIPGTRPPRETFVTFIPAGNNQSQMFGMSQKLRAAGLRVISPHITLVGEKSIPVLEEHGIAIDRSNKNNKHVIRTR
jgi:hypothetical protein